MNRYVCSAPGTSCGLSTRSARADSQLLAWVQSSQLAVQQSPGSTELSAVPRHTSSLHTSVALQTPFPLPAVTLSLCLPGLGAQSPLPVDLFCLPVPSVPHTHPIGSVCF